MATQAVPTTPANNPWDAADNPVVKTGGPSDYFGQVRIGSWFCVLVKGTGKVPFDPGMHSMDKRITAIDMEIFPLAEMNISWQVTRNLIAESREWAGIVLPSIKALGISPQQLDGKWVYMVRRDTGRTYTNKDGEAKPETTFEFKQMFGNEAECRAAYQAYSAGAGVPPAAQSSPVSNGTNAERDTVAKFLPIIVTNAVRGQTDLTVIRNTVAANISNMPALAKYFTVDSPEVMSMIMAEMQKSIPF
jgi:hypothetical protein